MADMTSLTLDQGRTPPPPTRLPLPPSPMNQAPLPAPTSPSSSQPPPLPTSLPPCLHQRRPACRFPPPEGHSLQMVLLAPRRTSERGFVLHTQIHLCGISWFTPPPPALRRFLRIKHHCTLFPWMWTTCAQRLCAVFNVRCLVWFLHWLKSSMRDA